MLYLGHTDRLLWLYTFLNVFPGVHVHVPEMYMDTYVYVHRLFVCQPTTCGFRILACVSPYDMWVPYPTTCWFRILACVSPYDMWVPYPTCWFRTLACVSPYDMWVPYPTTCGFRILAFVGPRHVGSVSLHVGSARAHMCVLPVFVSFWSLDSTSGHLPIFGTSI
jgi:hypothetical protein